MHMDWKTVAGNAQLTRKLKNLQTCAAHVTPTWRRRWWPVMLLVYTV